MTMDEKLHNKLEQAIKLSGFPFENEVSMLFKQHGWTIIPNRYYIDDVKGIEREIDILAYKSWNDNEENIWYYTALIISCKKSSSSKWCFITRDSDNQDINVDYFPFHFLTNDKRLQFMTNNSLPSFEKQYKKDKKVKNIYSFPKSIISYQQFVEDCFKKNEDIYNSIITTIKALESEKSNLLNRKKKQSFFYSFYLLSLFDGDMIDCNFNSDGSVSYVDITSINYLNRHIVNKEEHFYSVNFISKQVIDNKINEYDSLAECNRVLFPSMITSYYEDIFKDRERVMISWESFVSSTSFVLTLIISRELNRNIDIKIQDYSFEDGSLKLSIVETSSTFADINSIYHVLNNDEWAKGYVKKHLSLSFRYKGDFVFEDFLPF